LRRYGFFAAATVMLVVGLNAKPETSLVKWAKEEAEAKLRAQEGR